MTVTNFVPALAAALVFASACGGISLNYTVDDNKLKDMSRQGQLWIYDAENEIVVALDKLDDARDARHRVKQLIKRAELAEEAADKRGKQMAEDLAAASLKHLEALDEWAVALVQLERIGVVVARASVELAKAQVIQREDLLGGKDFAVGDYREQSQRLQDLYDRRAKAVRKLRRAARKEEAKWWDLRRRYVARTGDHDTGLWID